MCANAIRPISSFSEKLACLKRSRHQYLRGQAFSSLLSLLGCQSAEQIALVQGKPADEANTSLKVLPRDLRNDYLSEKTIFYTIVPL